MSPIQRAISLYADAKNWDSALDWTNACDGVIDALATARIGARGTQWLLGRSASATVSELLPLLNGCPDQDTCARYVNKQSA